VNHHEVVMVMLEMGADAHRTTSRGESALIVATRRGAFEAAQTLIECVTAR
jgi:hypothetical protein